MTAYERTIESGLQTFVEVGAALSAIRDSKLYRAGHGTFEEYCRERWGMSRPRAYQLIESASTVSTLVDKGIEPPQSERQARPLAKLPAEEQAPAWEEANEAAQAESREVTAKDVERAVSRRTSKPTTPEEEEAITGTELDHPEVYAIRGGALLLICSNYGNTPPPAALGMFKTFPVYSSSCITYAQTFATARHLKAAIHAAGGEA